MAEPSDQRESDDAVTRRSGAVSEDVQPLTTHENAEGRGMPRWRGQRGPERTDNADNLKTE
jgi:hypothetical protein